MFRVSISRHTGRIDASIYLDGYITNDPSFKSGAKNWASNSEMLAALTNLPLAGTVTVEIFQVDPILPNFQKLNILNIDDMLNLSNQNEKNHLRAFSGHSAIALINQTVQGYDLKGEMIHIRNSGMYECNQYHLNLIKLL